jgi:hypothetical protein
MKYFFFLNFKKSVEVVNIFLLRIFFKFYSVFNSLEWKLYVLENHNKIVDYNQRLSRKIIKMLFLKKNMLDICFSLKLDPESFNWFELIKLNFYFIKLIINSTSKLILSIIVASYSVYCERIRLEIKKSSGQKN